MEGPTNGHVVYFIACGYFVKVGYSSNVLDRIAKMQTANPQELFLVMTIGYPNQADARAGESRWRSRLTACGKPARGEWVELEYDVVGRALLRIQPLKGVHISDIVGRHTTNAGLLEEALSGRCRLRARLSEAP